MGADIVGWINCPLQKSLGPNGFFWKLKLSSLKHAIETQVPPENREEVVVKFAGNNREPRDLNYSGITNELGGFEAGIPECQNCPISCGKPLGCYSYVSYPIDETFERLVFGFFVTNVAEKDSICEQIYSDIISKYPRAGMSWHNQRGSAEQGGVAQLAAPLKHSWGSFFKKKSIDSAQVLAALFISLEIPAMVAGYARLWTELFEFAISRGITESRTLTEARELLQLCVAITPQALSENAVVLIEG